MDRSFRFRIKSTSETPLDGGKLQELQSVLLARFAKSQGTRVITPLEQKAPQPGRKGALLVSGEPIEKHLMRASLFKDSHIYDLKVETNSPALMSFVDTLHDLRLMMPLWGRSDVSIEAAVVDSVHPELRVIEPY